ncbi:MAG: Glycerate kinase [Pedosphaera sp.]|nr:Glycerate kinase [Pedosphaera sp.]
MARGWRRARPQDAVELLPMSDGGDGFGEVFSGLLRAKTQVVKTEDAAHRPCEARWWWEPKSKTAIIESAEIIGLAKMRGFHPLEMDTFGLGALVRAAQAKGTRRCLIGIGGSATNDGGFGVARALGWKFLDAEGQEIISWTRLHTLKRLIPPRRKRWFEEFIVAVDVQNPLLGAKGCTRIYGPQKGLTNFAEAEGNLRRLAKIAKEQLGRDCAAEQGAGAAGGLGFGLNCLLGARLEAGFDLFARKTGLRQRLRAVDLVITGEGTIDESTLMGKGVGRIAGWCRELEVPCIGLAGAATAGSALRKQFAEVHEMAELTTIEKAKRRPAFWLERLAARVGRGLQSSAIREKQR